MDVISLLIKESIAQIAGWSKSHADVLAHLVDAYKGQVLKEGNLVKEMAHKPSTAIKETLVSVTQTLERS